MINVRMRRSARARYHGSQTDKLRALVAEISKVFLLRPGAGAASEPWLRSAERSLRSLWGGTTQPGSYFRVRFPFGRVTQQARLP